MNRIPARIRASVSSTKVVLLIGLGVLPAALALTIPGLPGWVRLWIWAPIVGVPALVLFGRVDGRPVYEVLGSWTRYRGRQRRRVWRQPVRRVDAPIPVRQAQPSWGLMLRGHLGRAATYATVVACLIVVGAGLAAGLQWLLLGGMGEGEVQAARFTAPSSPLMTPLPSVTVTPTATLVVIPLPSVVPSPAPTASPVPPSPTEWAVERQWDVAAESGYLLMKHGGGGRCTVAVTGGEWESTFMLPGGVETRSVLVPYLLLQPVMEAPDFSGVFVVRSTCDLQVEVLSYRPYLMPKAQVWVVPVCTPPGVVMMKIHGGRALVGLAGSGSEVVVGGRLASLPQGEGCWLYWIESDVPVFPEVVVMAR